MELQGVVGVTEEQDAVVPPSAERRPPRSAAPSAVHSPAVRRYVAAVAALAVALAVLAGLVEPDPDYHRWWVGLLLLAAAFGTAETLALQVEVRRGNLGIPLTEVPLGAALLLLPFPVALAATCLVLVVLAAWRREHPVISTFNLAASTLEVATAYAVLALLPALPGSDLLGVFAALVIANLVCVLTALGLSVVVGGPQARGGVLDKLAGTATTMTVVAPLLVVLGVQLLRLGTAGWVLLGGTLVAFTALYRAYSVLLRERRDVGLVQEISQVVVGAEGVWPAVAELVRQQFNARRVVVRLAEEAPVVVAGDPAEGPEGTAGDVVSTSRTTRLFTRSGAEAAVLAALDARGVGEALVAPLAAGEGSIEVHDRQNQMRGFSPADVQLLDTLARHVSTAVDNQRLLAELRGAAYHDRLTGLSNRLGFTERAVLAPVQLARVWGVLLVDLGALGPVNDALGHGWGDRFVVQAAARVRAAVAEQVGPGAVLARVEGDVFAVLLTGASAEQHVRVAEVLAARLGAPYPLDELAVEATPAVGVAVLTLPGSPSGSDVEELLQHADVAVQAARAAGQPVRTYHDGMGLRYLRRFQLVTQFRAALAAGQVSVHYQPKLGLPGREVVGAEALMRWTHPEFGPVDPEELVRVLEATGLIDDLTRFVLDDSLGRCRAMLDRGLRIAPAVNVSVRNLLSPEFPGIVAAALARHDVPAAMLTLEITETSVMGDAERTLPALRVLHEMGVTLSVDDFGTGYSSLSYLRRLPVDELKIDKSFVLNMGTDLADLALVRAIIDLGRSLGLRVVAEGVETDVVRDQLAEMGCDVAQGYLIARPMDPARFDAWLHTRTAALPSDAVRAPVSPRLSG